jgi:hypothetical protein
VNRPALLSIGFAATCLMACGGDGDDPGTVVIDLVASGPVTRDAIAANGALVAQIPVDVSITGAPARVAVATDGGAAVDVDAGGHAVVDATHAGAIRIVATAFDAGGAAVATDEATVDVVEPDVDDCQGWLDLYGVEYSIGPDNPGVADPVTATTPINGLAFRYVANEEPRERLFADCNLILSLARAAPLFADRGVTEIADYGVYNYRCIGGEGTPPDCPRGMSQHAYANAIDLAGFTTADGYLTVEDDWVIDPESEATCAAATEAGPDAFLHEMICALKAAGTWNIVLTPNYNSDHRDHFHVDLTPDADFLRERGRVDHGPDHH